MLKKLSSLKFWNKPPKSRFAKKKANKPIIIILVVLTILTGIILAAVMTSKADREVAIKPILANGMLRIGLREDIDSFCFKDEKGELVGLEPDIAKEIVARLIDKDIPVEIVIVNSKSAKLALANGGIDLALGAYIAPESDSKISYSSPYFMDALVFLTDGGYTDTGKIGDKTIAVVTDTPAALKLPEYLTTMEILAKVKKYASYPDAVNALNTGKADVVCGSSVLIRNYASSLDLLPQVILRHGYSVMTGKGRSDLAQAIDEIILDMKSDGTLDNIAKKWGLINYWNL